LTLYDAVEEPDVEGYQMQPKLQAANSSPESSPTEPEVLLVTTNVNPEGTSELEIHPTPQKSATMQTPSGQWRRLYGCIQAAASSLEDSTKDHSTQRVTRLTKLIQRSPKHLGKFN
jgi:hypothetical protein